MTGADGQMDHLPSSLSPNQQAAVKITITNNLGRAADYTLIISLSDSMSATPADLSEPVVLSPGTGKSTTISLADGESHEQILRFSIDRPGDWTVYLRLVDAGGSEVRTLWLPITVR